MRPVVEALTPRSARDWWLIGICLAASVQALVIDVPRWVAALGWLFAGLNWWLSSLMQRTADEALALLREGA